jgi:CheY-like chemotaxis protein
MNILIVDDSLLARKSTQRLLQSKGHTTQLASSGKEALDLSQEHHYDLMILDLVMPGLDGIQVLEALQGRSSAPPVVVVTADTQKLTKKECLAAGAINVLHKPIDEEIFSIINTVTGLDTHD